MPQISSCEATAASALELKMHPTGLSRRMRREWSRKRRRRRRREGREEEGRGGE